MSNDLAEGKVTDSWTEARDNSSSYSEPQLSEFVVFIVYEYRRLLYSQLDYSDQSAIWLRILASPYSRRP